eukprot:765054-Hanusia_phi.AAC.1
MLKGRGDTGGERRTGRWVRERRRERRGRGEERRGISEREKGRRMRRRREKSDLDDCLQAACFLLGNVASNEEGNRRGDAMLWVRIPLGLRQFASRGGSSIVISVLEVPPPLLLLLSSPSLPLPPPLLFSSPIPPLLFISCSCHRRLLIMASPSPSLPLPRPPLLSAPYLLVSYALHRSTASPSVG